MENEKWSVRYAPAGSSQITGERFMDAVIEPLNVLVERFSVAKGKSERAEIIAAAPELLAACEAVAALMDGQGRRNLPEVAGMARAAIKKAKGEL